MFVVVGSGPSGVSCAHALLDAGAEVTMLDAGFELEPDRRARLDAVSRSGPQAGGGRHTLDFIRDGVAVAASGIPLKLAYGSSFPYRLPAGVSIAPEGVAAKPSFARGGFSNVWGASMLPFGDEEMTGWPIKAADLEPHYRAVLRLMPFAARRDRLEHEFPLHHDAPAALRLSAQTTAFLADAEVAASSLEDHGIRFGASRLAVQADSGNGQGCVYCALCMYGCPYGFIYNSSDTLDALREHPRFTYRSGILVNQLHETRHGVLLSGLELDARAPWRMRAEAVFLACGTVSTARVLMATLDAYERPLRAVDNCYFLLPWLRYRNRAGPDEAMHTLAQAFVEISDPRLGPHTAHLQVYSYNELYRQQVRNVLKALDRLFGDAVDRHVLGRMLLIQGYLHSDLSAGIDLTLRRDDARTLTMSVSPNPKTRPALSALVSRLWAERRSFRAVPLAPALRVGAPGRGFHTGGTFPMRERPQQFETDVWGRVDGLSRVHVVDASVFPSLPATTITLSVMANAHRIGAVAAA